MQLLRHYVIKLKQVTINFSVLVSLRWRCIAPSRSYDCVNDVPFQRYGHTVVAHGDLIYLWGGRNDECACNVLFCFDTVQRKWIPRPKVSGALPAARDGHSSCIIDNMMYVFGGYEEETDRFSQDVYVLDLQTKIWKYRHCYGTPPSWRDFHSAVAIGDKIFIFGGRSDQSGPYHSQQEVYCNEVR